MKSTAGALSAIATETLAKNAQPISFKEKPPARSHSAVVIDRPDRHQRAALRERQRQCVAARGLAAALLSADHLCGLSLRPARRIDGVARQRGALLPTHRSTLEQRGFGDQPVC